MNSLATLLAKVPRTLSSRLVSNGIACWICYPQAPSVSFFQSLSDMGGWSLAEEKTQVLWFFPDPMVMIGLARLHNWARLNPIAAAVTVFECSLIVGEAFERSLSVKAELSNLEVGFPKRLVVRVTSHLRELGRSMTGVSFKQSQNLDGLAGKWFDLESSEQLTVSTSTNWLWLIRPIGTRQDKIFTKGWRSYFERIEPLLTQNKVVYQHGEDHVLMLKISSLRTLARLILEIMTLVGSADVQVWPCEYLIMELDSHSFTPDFPKKMLHVFEALESGVLYMPLATMFQIADPRLTPVESRFSMSRTKISDFFQVQISMEGGTKRHGSLNILLPSPLVSGSEAPCFYCGLRSHPPVKCPSRRLQPANTMINYLDRFGQMGLDALPGLFQALDKRLSSDLLQDLSNLLMEKGDLATVVGAMFDVNQTCQLRMMNLVWRAKGKQWPDGIQDLRDPGEELIWSAFDAMRTGHIDRASQQLDQYILKAHKNYQPRLLQGFMAMERGELKRARGYWEEAEGLTYTPLQRSYVQFLQGRLCEVQGVHQEAVGLYGKALRESSRFLPARYRQAVCLIKSGFLAEAQGMLRDLIQQDPDFFSVMLLDPELEGGRTLILADLWDIWQEADRTASEIVGSVEHLPDLLDKWLPRDHDAYRGFAERIQGLSIHSGIGNYVATAKLIRGTLMIRDEIQARVKKDIKELGAQRKVLFDRLLEIQHEASWFPFPRLLHHFNELFNHCGEQLQMVGQLDLYVPDKFRRAHEAVRAATQDLKKLEQKLLFLQTVRNAVLFSLLSGKYLLFFEVIAIVVSGGISLGLIYFFPKQGIMGRDLRQDRWLVLNICLILFSFFAVVGAALRASSQFEAYKNRILDTKG